MLTAALRNINGDQAIFQVPEHILMAIRDIVDIGFRRYRRLADRLCDISTELGKIAERRSRSKLERIRNGNRSFEGAISIKKYRNLSRKAFEGDRCKYELF